MRRIMSLFLIFVFFCLLTACGNDDQIGNSETTSDEVTPTTASTSTIAAVTTTDGDTASTSGVISATTAGTATIAAVTTTDGDITPTSGVISTTTTTAYAEDGVPQKNVNILCIGDSITAGDGTPSGYRYELYKYLYQRGACFSLVGPYRSKTDVRLPERYNAYAAYGGCTIEGVIKDVDYYTNRQYDVVLLMIGTNNIWNNPDTAIAKLCDLLDKLYEKSPTASIYVAEPISGKKGDDAANRASFYDIFHKKLPDVCKEYKDKGVKITLVKMDYEGEVTRKVWTDDMFHDGTHPNEKGNALIAERFGAAVLNDLKERSANSTAVEDKPVRVSKLTLSQSEISLEVGGAKSLKATVSPNNAEVFSVDWTSSNTQVATVDSYGKVIAHKAGTATITAASFDGNFKKTCTVTVSASTEPASTSVFSTDFTTSSGWTGSTSLMTWWGGFSTSWDNNSSVQEITTQSLVDAGQNFKVVFDYRTSGNRAENFGKKDVYSSVTYGGFEVRVYNTSTFIELYRDGKLIGEYAVGYETQAKQTFTLKYRNGRASVLVDGEEVISVNAATPQNASKNVVVRLGEIGHASRFTNLLIFKYN